ncbi:cAMP-binding domain protein [Vibrio harveyi]|uniref:cAMP-binding domain protein n=1 Tax=Vibrio harveyi TaxID=669 RepID=A0A454CP92_VIBHA|nr:cAMP-binding domain protein [Vibrio harveyi]
MGVTARNGKTFLLGTLECEQQVFGELKQNLLQNLRYEKS